MILSDGGFLNEVWFFGFFFFLGGGEERREEFIYVTLSILSLNIHQC